MSAMSWATDFLAIGGNIIGSLKAGISAKVQAVVETMRGVGTKISSTFKSILGIASPSKVFSGFGGDIMSGLINGIKAKLQELKSAVTGVASKAAGWFKSKLGINSPSRVFMGFGGNLSEGLAIGIDQEKARVFASMEGIRRGLARPMLATATIGAASMAGVAHAGPGTGLGDIEQASAQIASVGRSVSVSSSDTFNITITGEFNQDAEDRLRTLLEEHERQKMLERERFLND